MAWRLKDSEKTPWDARLEGAGVFRLRQPLPPMLGSVNLYLCLEPRPLLIDSGMILPAASDELEQTLASFGLKPRDIQGVYLTHAHSDHAGGAAILHGRQEIPIRVHPLEAPRLNGEQLEFLIDTLPGYLLRLGFPAAGADAFMGALENTICNYRRQVIDFFPLETGSHISFGRLSLEVILTPGHTPGSVCYFDRDQRILLGGDTLQAAGPPRNVFSAIDRSAPYNGGLRDMEKTITRLARLSPAVVFGGHGEPGSGGPIIESAQMTLSRIRENVWKDLRPGATVYDMVQPPEGARFLPVMMKLAEYRSALEALSAEGRVRVEEAGGLERFFPA